MQNVTANESQKTDFTIGSAGPNIVRRDRLRRTSRITDHAASRHHGRADPPTCYLWERERERERESQFPTSGHDASTSATCRGGTYQVGRDPGIADDGTGVWVGASGEWCYNLPAAAA